MKGLLLKDFYFVSRRNKLLLIIAMLFTVVGSATLLNVRVFSSSYLYGIFFFMIATMSTLTYDEATKWHVYCDTFPVSRKTFVTEKYIFIIGSTVALWLISSILIILSNIRWQVDTREMLNIIMDNLSMVIGLSVMPCIIFPLTFKFGYQKARIVLFVLIGLYSGSVAMVLSRMSDTENISLVQHLVQQTDGNLPVTGIVIGVTVVLCVISWLISVKVYKKREL